jgi:hypothetical protein
VGGVAAGCELIELGEFGGRGGEADVEAFDLAEPVLLLGFGDSVAEVVADLDEARPLRRIGSKEGTAKAAVFVNAVGSIGATAVAKRDSAALEVAEELLPFLLGGGAVLLAGAKGATAGDERAVAVDGLLGVDRFVSHRGVDVLVADHELGDVWWHPVHDGVGDEEPTEVVGQEPQCLTVGAGQAGQAQCGVEQLADGGDSDRAVLGAYPSLEQGSPAAG